MASSYPGAKDAFVTSHQDAVNEKILAATINDMADAINKIENELGINPKGGSADVATRLAAPRLQTFVRSGAIAVTTGQARFYFPIAATIVGVQIAVGTPPTGAAIIADVNKNGTTVFTTQGNRPQIAIGANSSAVKTPDVTAVVAGDYLTVDVDQIGSTVAGSDLTAIIQYRV